MRVLGIILCIIGSIWIMTGLLSIARVANADAYFDNVISEETLEELDLAPEIVASARRVAIRAAIIQIAIAIVLLIVGVRIIKKHPKAESGT